MTQFTKHRGSRESFIQHGEKRAQSSKNSIDRGLNSSSQLLKRAPISTPRLAFSLCPSFGCAIKQGTKAPPAESKGRSFLLPVRFRRCGEDESRLNRKIGGRREQRRLPEEDELCSGKWRENVRRLQGFRDCQQQ